ncbi:MAG: hypothetical protein ACD_26C00031G0009 [uncultured bacterium]|nr:MAG: hypothetical protein ACD_26C00031G0009 [uncultured bacterium]
MDTNSNTQFNDWFRNFKKIATEEHKPSEEHDGFKVRWEKTKPPPIEKGKLISDFIFTYVYPINPFGELLAPLLQRAKIKIDSQVITFLFFIGPLSLGLLLYFVKYANGSYWVQTTPSAFIIFMLFYYFVKDNIFFFNLMFWSILIIIYILGYYQLLKKDHHK